MNRGAAVLIGCIALSVLIFWWLTIPVTSQTQAASSQAFVEGDPIKGERIFWAGGCGSCHAKDNAQGDEKLKLGGGHRLETPFGVFLVPNISPDQETGIGTWTAAQFFNAVVHGVTPSGKHYYPAFPYTSYNKMPKNDVMDLWAFMKTLPEVSQSNEPHELALPFQWRRPLGIWKRLFVTSDWAFSVDPSNEVLVQGRYLVEALGHCGECHTPRNILGGTKTEALMAGGPSPEGRGRIPNITPHQTGIGSWSASDITYYLESGFTPDFDSVGGSMVSVQENMTKLSAEDREAIAAYLKAIPAIASE